MFISFFILLEKQNTYFSEYINKYLKKRMTSEVCLVISGKRKLFGEIQSKNIQVKVWTLGEVLYREAPAQGPTPYPVLYTIVDTYLV